MIMRLTATANHGGIKITVISKLAIRKDKITAIQTQHTDSNQQQIPSIRTNDRRLG